MHTISPTDERNVRWLAEQAVWQLQDILRFEYATGMLSGSRHMDAQSLLGQVANIVKDPIGSRNQEEF